MSEPQQEATHDPTVWTEVWRERPGDYYADSIHVSAEGAVKFECGGRVCVKPSARAWLNLAWSRPEHQPPPPNTKSP